MRVESDKEMSAAWVIVPLLPIIVGVALILSLIAVFFTIAVETTPGGQLTPAGAAALSALLGLFGLFYAIIFIVLILFAVMLYKLVKRRNTHFSRQFFLYEDLTNMAKELAAKKGVDVSLSLNNLDRSLREARAEETEKSAALWAILSFVTGLAVLYVYYFLMKDFFKHERREDIFIEDLNRTFTATGLAVNLPRRTFPIPDRSFILYLILTIITLGLFSIYWVYVLLTDPNNHFRQQAMIEDTIITQASPLLT